MQDRVRGGLRRAGKIEGYPLEQLFEEVAYVAYHFHWPMGEILSLPHIDRRQWVLEISKINQQLNAGPGQEG